jgi:hypothetical protein
VTNNVLIDEANRKHAEHTARAAAVAGAKSFAEAHALGAVHAQKEAAERANAAAYSRGVALADRLPSTGFTPEEVEARASSRIAAKAARRAAAKAPQRVATGGAGPAAMAPAGKLSPAASTKAPSLMLNAGDIALRAIRHQIEQEQMGRRVSTAEAVAFIHSILK